MIGRELVRGAWRKSPVETVVVVLAGLGVLGAIHDVGGLWPLRLLLTGILITPLAFTAHRLGVRRQAVIVAALFAGVLGALAVGLESQHTFDEPRFSYPFGLALLASLVVPFIAARRQFTHFMRRFFEETTTWGLLWGVAMIALGVIGLALDGLFDLRLDHNGVDVAITAMTAAVVLIYLDRLRGADGQAPGRMPELWRRLATAIGAPFVCVMLAILVVYEVSAIVHDELPRNVLSPLILGAGFVGFVSTLIVSSVLGEPPTGVLVPATRHAWAHDVTVRVMRAFPLVLLFLLPMAGWALWLRIAEYGLTPARVMRAYGVACLAVLSLAGAWRWWRGRDPLTWQVPAAIFVFSLAAAFGPASAVRLSVRSQVIQLAHKLDALGIGREVMHDEPAHEHTLAWQAFSDVQNRISLLASLGGAPVLRQVLTGEVALCAERWNGYTCLQHLGVQDENSARTAEAKPAEPASLASADEVRVALSHSFPTAHGRLIWIDDTRRHGDGVATSDAIAAAEAEHGGVILGADRVEVYRRGALVAQTSLAALLAPATLLPSRAVDVIDRDGKPVGELVIRELSISRDGGSAEVVHLVGALTWNEK